MGEKKFDIIAETYLEVVTSNEGGWYGHLVMESVDEHHQTLKHTLAEFVKEADADEWADTFRFLYDKSIFEYELM
jgi:hypothetical protein